MLDTSDLSVVGYKKNSSNGSAVLRQKPRSKSATPMCTGVNLAGILGTQGQMVWLGRGVRCVERGKPQ